MSWFAYYVARELGTLAESELGSSPARDDGYLLPDERARQAACAALEADPSLDASRVTVRVLSGALDLSGNVSTAEMRARAEALCAAIPGVRSVENSLSIGSERDS